MACPHLESVLVQIPAEGRTTRSRKGVRRTEEEHGAALGQRDDVPRCTKGIGSLEMWGEEWAAIEGSTTDGKRETPMTD